MARWWLSLLLLAACGAPGGEGGEAPRVHGPQFRDVAAAAGITRETISGTPEKRHIVECNTGGTALFDYDGDGDIDIFLVNGWRLEGFAAGREPRAALYRNDGDWHFAEVAAAAGVDHAGWGMGATAVDYNGDGHVDLYLANYGPNALYRNNGDGTFAEVAAAAGVDFPGWSSAATFGDYDGDGDLDFYLSNYIDFDPDFVPADMSFCSWRGLDVFYGPRGMPGERDRLYRNDGAASGWTFAEASAQFGLEAHDYYGFAAQAGDYDNDGDLDLYIANDSTPNLLYRNDGGRFRDVSLIAAVAYSEDGREQGGMGVASGDYDGDLDLDLFVTNFSHDNNTLYQNDGRGYFTDASFTTVLGRESITYLGWGADFFDYDNDGDLDLFVANGHVYPAVDERDLGTRYAQRNQLFENEGGVFREVGRERGPGFAVEKSSRGSAIADLDDDGDLDIVIVNIDDSPTVLRNDGGNAGNWLLVRLVGRGANTQAIGARAIAAVGARRQLREVRAGTGYISQGDVRLHFGLGRAEQVDRLQVRWPDGRVEVFENLAANRAITIVEGRGIAAAGAAPASRP